MADFGSGIGDIIGGSMGASDLKDASMTVRGEGSDFGSMVQPNITFGQSWLPAATNYSNTAGTFASQTQGYDDFMSRYSTSPAAKYALDQATTAQNNSAAARGGLLSGANERALSSINQGIGSQYANQAFNEYLQGNNQQFGQIQSLVNNAFQGIGVGSTATGQYGSVLGTQMGAQSSLAQAQAKQDDKKGSGIGSLFSGVGSMFAAF